MRAHELWDRRTKFAVSGARKKEREEGQTVMSMHVYLAARVITRYRWFHRRSSRREQNDGTGRIGIDHSCSLACADGVVEGRIRDTIFNLVHQFVVKTLLSRDCPVDKPAVSEDGWLPLAFNSPFQIPLHNIVQIV